MFGFDLTRKMRMIRPEEALPGRPHPIPTAETHAVFGRRLDSPIPEGMEETFVGMGCFWGAERLFWQQPGVWLTMVGYGAGYTPNPTYEEVCSGRTGHAELVRIIFDPAIIPYARILQLFWENHDPTQGMRQGNDRGTQYRSGLYPTTSEQEKTALESRKAYEARLKAAGFGPITTEIRPVGTFYLAESYHQQYLAKNPGGYCGLRGTGVACPVGVGV